ncbi:M2 family metallopeptidase [Edaphobacter bradus]|uniref:M2 family metallopeptidase n=1 Tax=Edaphobacter bradus TaxID=2259016 RepID=UPI0021E04661|nr:M2 family metallopeptidase [Edaphobacter bradus]
MRIYRFALAFALLPALTFAQTAKPTAADAQAFMDKAETELLNLANEASRASWVQETYITDDTEAISAKASERLLNKTNELVIGARRFDGLTLPPDLARKFKLLKLNANPTDPKLVAELTQVSSALDGMYGKGKYCRQGAAGAGSAEGEKCLGIEELDVLMAKSRDPKELEDLWRGWHTISPPMRAKYSRLVELSNEGAREFGYKDTGDLWRSRYDMTPAEFSAEMERTWTQLEPLYKELHAYVRFALIKKYGAAAERPDGMIPAHLLGNMWAQEWGNIYDLVAPPATGYKMYDLEGALKQQIGPVSELDAAKKMAKYGEGFFTSLGFEPLPATFWERSQFIKPRDRDVVCHASAWDVDNDQDLRVKMCIKVDADNFTTVHHEEGHNFYQRAYRNRPFLFRDGANDGFHEAIGDAIALSITPDYLKQLKLIDEIPPAEADIPLQLRTALDKIAFLPFGLLIDKWRWQVFSGQTKPEDYNKAWWELREKYQGVAPPVARTEADFDPGAKYHIPGNVPYARYFLARVYQFQFYKAMCDASGYKGPLNRCSFYGSKEAGAKLNAMLEAGQSKPWQETLKAMTGEDHLDAGPMLEYFAPLYQWLKQQNAANGVKVGWEAK